MKKFQKALFALVLTAAATLMVANTNVAADPSSGNGMRVSPVRTDLVIQPGSTKTISVYVQNVTKGTESLNVLKNDFVASSDESGSPSLLLNGESNDRHGLKQYMSTVKSVTIAPGKQQEIKVAITIPKGTAGGGYYGAVRFAPTTGASGSNVSLSGSVGSLILVKVPGEVTEKMSLAGFSAASKDGSSHTIFTSSKDIKAVVRFKNSGNIQEQPFGKIILKHGDKVLGQYEVNSSTQPGNVLPDSIRKFNVDLKDVGSFGKYTLEGNFGYGSNGQLLSGSTSFYIIPLPIIILAVIAILLIVFLIFGLPRMIRSYNRRIVRKSSRR